MSLDYEMPLVLPSLQPLFPSSCGFPMTLFMNESEEQREQSEEAMARYFGVPLPTFLRRSSSSRNSQPEVDSPTHTDGSNETEHSGEEEKLRVSRERNRLHAQRTRLRKRELLQSLTDRIKAFEDEFELLQQAYDFHLTAVCLLRLGTGYDGPTGLKRSNTMEDRHEGERSKTHEHEQECELKDGDDSCSCAAAQLNANGKRPYLSTAAASNVLLCSKEERERMRRERNRLHARRARLRKKLVLEKSQQAVHDLRVRNDRLRRRLSVLLSSIYGSEACVDDLDAMS